MADVTLDRVIEAVADAVTQLVLFSVEAEENNSMLQNIAQGTTAVKMAVDALINIAEEMAGRYGSEPKIQSKMVEEAQKVRGATKRILEAGQQLQQNAMHKEAKKDLLVAAKIVLGSTVAELHFADKYDVTKLVKAAMLCKAEIAKCVQPGLTADLLLSLARTLSAAVVNVVKLVKERVAILVDPVMRRGLDEAQNTVREGTQTLVKAMGRVLQEGSAAAKAEQNRIANELERALDIIIQIAKDSCKMMFSDLDLDFDLNPPKKPTIQDLREAHDRIVREIGRLDSSIKNGAHDDAANALHMVNNAVRQEVNIATAIADDVQQPHLKTLLIDACDNIENLPAGLAPAAKRAIARNSDAASKAEASKLETNIIKASEAVLAAAEAAMQGLSAEELLRQKTIELEDELHKLLEAVENHDLQASAEHLKKVREDVAQHILFGKKLAEETDDPALKKKLLDAVDVLEHVQAQLIPLTKLALQGDPAARAQLEALLGEAETAAKLIADIAEGKISEYMTEASGADPDSLLAAVNEMNKNLERIPPGIAKRDKKEVDSASIGVKDAVIAQEKAAKELGEASDDADRKKNIVNAVDSLDAALQSFLQNVNSASVKPTDRNEQAKLAKATADLKSASAKAVAAAIPSMQNQLLDNSIQLVEALDDIGDAVKSRDRSAAEEALEDAEDAKKKQVAMAHAFAALTPDPAKKKNLLDAANELDKLALELANAMNNALDRPNDKVAQQRLADVIAKMKEADAKVITTIMPDETLALKAGQAATQEMRQALDALRAGDRENALKLLDDLEQKMKRQGALCRALGIRSPNSNTRKALFEAAMGLQNSLMGLLGPIRDALQSGNDQQAMKLLERLLDEALKRDKNLEDALYQVAEPVDEIMIAARKVERAVAAKQFDESTPEGRLYAAARKVAQDMALLSDAAARGAKSEVIMIARRIAQHANAIMTNAQAVAGRCKDPILADQVMSIAHTVQTMTVQLKIITAVKAASDSNDTTIKAQLVKCAKSLANNVVGVVNAVEIASIRM